MKKHTFYSLVYGGKNGPIIKKWDGYTDGRYNYYKNEYSKWYAIEPTTGLSVINYRNTRKECEIAANAPGIIEKVKNAIKTDMQLRFNNLVAEAMAEELQKCS